MPIPRTLGILAHVDAGKTTLSEQILYRTGAIRALGRVDHGDTALDTDLIERERGITVFSDQAWFDWNGRRFTLIDTPGHVDFAAEAERALTALDMAVLIVDGGSGVQAHTAALFELAQTYHVPTVLFVNKTDLPSYDADRLEKQLASRLNANFVEILQGAPDAEQLAVLDDAFCERYLMGETDENDAWQSLAALFAQRKAFPVLKGAALSGQGVEELLSALERLAGDEKADDSVFDALVYKVRRETNGDRVVYLKIKSGTLRARDAFRFGDSVEKVHQIRLYRGASYTTCDEAHAGDTVGVTGLSTPRCGDRISGDTLRDSLSMRITPVLSARVEPPQGVAPAVLLEKLRILEDEEPMLGVAWDAAHSAVTVQVMGTVQTEVLTQLMENRFGMKVRFLPPLVLYKETIASPVVGCGHYEPLRHYAETHLLLTPGKRGSGIDFDSRCHVDDLTINYQAQIRSHVFERVHKGVLTGSPLTDIHFSLLSGRAHLKHTEGGDFREATYRAIRQGLMKADCVLLEPFYRFVFTVPADCLGRAMTDITSMFGTYDAPEHLGDEVRISGRGPVRTFMDYPTALRAYTHGKGGVQLQPDGYDLCHNRDEVIAEIGYDCGADVQNSPGSVFCSHGAGFLVNWDEADSWMHLPVEKAD
ncbi:MAG: TetM/TetW/TetO/TetS family tetracycline resistance ribosomal protection protein [Clostridia bacterium]|nr:TetM/TetW/TetO/TetS family tetracycline resistance ribosomal protection protein [Clostridia bacterium]